MSDPITTYPIRIRRPGFVATEWVPTRVHGEPGWEMSESFEWNHEESKWDGFVAIQKTR